MFLWVLALGGGCHGGATSSYVITVYGCCGGCVVVADVVLGNYDVANIGAAAAAAFAAPDFNLFFFDLPKVVLCVHAQLHLYLNWNSIHRVCA